MSETNLSDGELNRLIEDTPASELLSHPRLQDVAPERLVENETFVEKLGNELGLVHKSELEASSTVTGGGSDHDLEAFGTGVSGQTESTPAQIEAARRSEELRTAPSDDPDDYPVGIDGAGDRDRDGSDELTADQRESALSKSPDNQSSEPLEAFGTGVSGDTSYEEYREREKEIDRMAEAFKRARDTDTEE